MAGVRIVTDSACDLTDEEVARHGIEVVPLSIRFGSDELEDRTELTVEGFYEMMEKRFANNGANAVSSALGGLRVAAEMVNLLDSAVGTSIMGDIGKNDEALSQKIQDLMFVFDDLLEIDDRGMQELLRQVPADKLLIALKGAEPQLRDAILGAMPKRQAQSFEDLMRRSGPVPMSRIEQTRREIMATVKDLADAGEIDIALFAEATAE